MCAGLQMLPQADVDSISKRLAHLGDLRLPASLQQRDNPADDGKKEAYLQALLARDPGVFLERYAGTLQPEELQAFEPLRESSYEVDFWLKANEDAAKASASPGIGTVAKNRRLAKMQALMDEGSYFSEEAMRRRNPLLHEQMLGGAAPAPTQPAGGPSLSSTLLAQHDEVQTQLRKQQQRDAEEQQRSEHESDEDDGGSCQDESAPAAPQEAAAQQQPPDPEQQEEFLKTAQQSFLAGQDRDMDYAAIDADATLDDLDQQQQDAEERYFDAD